MRDSLLFVYGTLRPFVDIPAARWLRRVARYVSPATTEGRLFDLGAYPGMCKSRGRGELVVGDVYRISNPRVLRELDRYERGDRGKPRFVRERCVVRLARGVRKAAWAYRYCYATVSAPRISGGDYRVHCAKHTR